jgi:hypothetical protein
MRPRASLGRVLDDLGATLLELAHGKPDRPDAISGVVIHDPLDDPVLPPHALYSGSGCRSRMRSPASWLSSAGSRLSR